MSTDKAQKIQNTFKNQIIEKMYFYFFMKNEMTYLFTSESVSEWHPDKIADQISDAIVDEYLAQDPDSKVACETLVTTWQVIIAWEVKSKAHIDANSIARHIINKIWYTKSEYKFDGDSCWILTAIHEQSPDINRGIERENNEDQWAWDQWMMFWYACNETENYMPLSLDLSHKILKELSEIRHEGKEMTYLRPDSKSQVTVEYWDNNKPKRIHTIVISTQHDDFISPENNNKESQLLADKKMLDIIENDIRSILIPRIIDKLPENTKKLFDENLILYVNPTWKFVIWWPNGDTGLTGRKIIVDTYGWRWAHWGWAFSGKDPSKVDRSAAYAARHIAKNIVAAGISDEVLVQVAYAIWVAKPVSLYINTYWKSKISLSDWEISEKINNIFDMRPKSIEKRFNLRSPIYLQTASYGHFWRKNESIKRDWKIVELFPREKLDYVEKIKQKFGI